MNNRKMLTKEQFYVLNELYNGSKGRLPVFSDLFLNRVMEESRVIRELTELGLVDGTFDTITAEGIAALEPYRVEKAVILAAGMSSRCIPLSIELPKGLFKVKGEVLIERQIKQLREAGIRDITVVLGYKKEMFQYLQQRYQVKFIENDAYQLKHNIHSLYLAREDLENAYICSCDDYFPENPFNRFEYETFFAGIHTDKRMNEMYVHTDEDRRIVRMQENLDKGMILMGHCFWSADFARAFLEVAQRYRRSGEYDDHFWERLVRDHLDQLPQVCLKQYAARGIVEFDYFDDLRRFDSGYVKNTHSRIVHNIISVFGCDESDILDFRNVSEGMTNTSFIFSYKGVDYIYRHPGDGTEKIISRKNEKHSLELAKQWGIDPTYVHMDVEQGWKISEYVADFREPVYADFDDARKVIGVLKRLHSLPIRVDYGLQPWEDALDIQHLLEQQNPDCFAPYQDLKEKIGRLYAMTQGDGIEKCFCHADTYKPNWMIRPDGSVILIDWEYSGYSDPGIDVGYYIVDAAYDFPEAERFIGEYLDQAWSERSRFHFMAYTALIAYYWFVWALYRESCGAVIGESLILWRDMARKYAEYLLA